MDYLKVPELLRANSLPFVAGDYFGTSPICFSNGKGVSIAFAIQVLNAVYTPTTGLLAQIEDQKRVIEELRGKVEEMSIKQGAAI